MTAELEFEHAALSDAGRVRTANEDTVLVDPPMGLAVVCDGIGGHAAGAVASQRAAAAVRTYLQGVSADAPLNSERASEALEAALRHANQHIVELAAEHEQWRDMGTTCTAILTARDAIVVGHVGDSRCYRLRSHGAERLTFDHTTVEVAQRFYGDDPPPIRQGPGILVQALGKEPASFRPAVAVHRTVRGDIFLLCSDGLSDELGDAEIAQIAAPPMPLDDACRRLIERANAHGGRDNISVVLMRIVSDPVASREALPRAAPRRTSRQHSLAMLELLGWILAAAMSGIVLATQIFRPNAAEAWRNVIGALG